MYHVVDLVLMFLMVGYLRKAASGSRPVGEELLLYIDILRHQGKHRQGHHFFMIGTEIPFSIDPL